MLSRLKLAVRQVKDELGKIVDVLARSVHDHHGLLFTSLQVSVVTRWYIGEVIDVCSRAEKLKHLVHPFWARCIDQRGTLRYLSTSSSVESLVSGVKGT